MLSALLADRKTCVKLTSENAGFGFPPAEYKVAICKESYTLSLDERITPDQLANYATYSLTVTKNEKVEATLILLVCIEPGRVSSAPLYLEYLGSAFVLFSEVAASYYMSVAPAENLSEFYESLENDCDLADISISKFDSFLAELFSSPLILET